MKTVLLFLLILYSVTSNSQQTNHYKSYKDLIKPGWEIDTVIYGDLNGDKINDIVLITIETNQEKFVKNDGLGNEIRNITVLLANKNKTYSIVASNSTFLPSPQSEESPCLEDPLYNKSIFIKNNLLKINLHYWLSCGSWYVTNYTYTFRYQNLKLELIGLDCNSFHRASGMEERNSVNFLTKKKQTITGLNMFEKSESKPKEKWETIKIDKLYNLSTVTTDDVLGLVQL